MHTLVLVGAFIASHWQSIAAGLTALMSLVGTLQNLLTKHPKAETVLAKALDVLAFAAKYGAKGVPYLGRFSVPGLPSRPNGQSAQVINIADAKKDKQ